MADSGKDRGIAQCKAALSLQQDYSINPPALQAEGIAPEGAGGITMKAEQSVYSNFLMLLCGFGAGAGHAAEVFDRPA